MSGLDRRQVLKAGTAGMLGAALARPFPAAAVSDPARFFRIGTGSTAGTYFPIGSLIALALSHPTGSRECERGGTCGVPGLIAVAQSTSGSLDNVQLMQQGLLEAGMCQADTAYWAFNGAGPFEGEKPLTALRFVANLFPEAIHLVARRMLNLRKPQDLVGRRVSIDTPGSGTRYTATLLLEAYGLRPGDYVPVSQNPGDAADLLGANEIDAMVVIGGTPVRALEDLANTGIMSLIPIEGEATRVLFEQSPFFQHDLILPGIYRNIPATPTVSVGAHLLTTEAVPQSLIYGITKSLWHPKTRELLDQGHPKGQLIRKETALAGRSLPLHPGAEAYYLEAGMLTDG